MKQLTPSDLCPHCKEHGIEPNGILCLMREQFPYTTDHLSCNKCGSTYNLKFEPLWQEDINGLACDTCDFLQEKLSKYKIQLDTEKEDELVDLIVNYLDKFGYGDYKHYH
jgi:hypothetical protein